jgi:peptide/nickel transport system substrate-binding protein
MKLSKLGALAGTSLALASLLAAGGAFAQENCIRVMGYESDGDKQSADPALINSTDNSYHLQSVTEPLLALDNSWEPYPVLATSWEPNEDGTVWTFHLREGVKFHDGTDFDSGDVVYTYRRLLDPEVGSAAKAVLGAFLEPDGIQAPDAHTVVFNLTKPVADFPVQQREKLMQIIPDGTTTESLKSWVVGTGPYKLERFTPGGPERILVKNPDYWQPGVPKNDCVRITVNLEPVSRMTALLAGDVDILLAVDPASLVALRDNPDVTLVRTPGATGMNLAMWVDTPPFDDLRVRQALKLVVDRQAIVDTVLLGFGEAGNDVPVPPSSPAAYRGDIIPRDVERAKALLAEAGYPDGIDLDLYLAEAYPGMLLTGQAYAEMAKDAGIRINLIRTPDESFWDDIWLKKSFITSAWGARPPALALSVAYRKGAAWNETHWARDDYDALLDKAGATIDPTERAKVIAEAQTLLAEEGGVIMPAFASVVAAMRKGCTGYTPHIQVNYINYTNIVCE